MQPRFRLQVPCIQPRQPDWELEVYKEIDSTHKECLRRISQSKGTSPAHHMVILSGKQTKGVGTGGRRWASDFYGGVLLNIILHLPTLQDDLSRRLSTTSFSPAEEQVVDDFFASSMSQGLIASVLPYFLSASGIIAAVRTAKEMADPVAIQWPNDIHYNNCKLGGIIAHVDMPWATVGIGINVRQSQERLDLNVTDRCTTTIRTVRNDLGFDGFVTVRSASIRLLHHLGCVLYLDPLHGCWSNTVITLIQLAKTWSFLTKKLVKNYTKALRSQPIVTGG